MYPSANPSSTGKRLNLVLFVPTSGQGKTEQKTGHYLPFLAFAQDSALITYVRQIGTVYSEAWKCEYSGNHTPHGLHLVDTSPAPPTLCICVHRQAQAPSTVSLHDMEHGQ